MLNALVITDNSFLYNAFYEIVKNKEIKGWEFKFRCSTKEFSDKNHQVAVLDIQSSCVDDYFNTDIIISLHCKQLFPEWLVNLCRCINVHPGFNPFNRGWYPQAFSIINGLPIGATIHEIDTELDHGKIIIQKEVPTFSWDTSFSLYERVLAAEIELINNNLLSILNNNYISFAPLAQGNINLKKDFDNLKEIDLSKSFTGKQFLDYTRAMTHLGYQNLYYTDPNTKRKVFIEIKMEPESE